MGSVMNNALTMCFPDHAPLDAILIHETQYCSHKLYLSILATAHHPKNRDNKGAAVVPGLVWITNMVFLGRRVGG